MNQTLRSRHCSTLIASTSASIKFKCSICSGQRDAVGQRNEYSGSWERQIIAFSVLLLHLQIIRIPLQISLGNHICENGHLR